MAETVASLDDMLGPGAEAMLQNVLERRLLGGVAVGLVRDGKSFLRFVGAGVDQHARFELGSVTKTYTAELLAILVARGVVRLDDPLAKYVPGDREAGKRPITLLDLATHRSGLPRVPLGIPLLSLDPYARYSEAKLERYLARWSMQLPKAPRFLYSNLGYSVLGYALGRAAGTTYAELLEREILQPLGMTETALALGQRQPNLLPGHSQAGLRTPHWHFQACAPCGALCSTAGDQLKYAEWLLQDPQRLAMQPQATIPGGEMGLAWMILPGRRICFHNGATFGFSSWLSIDRERGTALVILSDRMAAQLLRALAGNFQRMLDGRPIVPLRGDYGRMLAACIQATQLLMWPFNRILSPLAGVLARIPLLLRIPAALALGYGLDRLIKLLGSH
jgi:CubicO group peptidase (beta-lactamase class C family)